MSKDIEDDVIEEDNFKMPVQKTANPIHKKVANVSKSAVPSNSNKLVKSIDITGTLAITNQAENIKELDDTSKTMMEKTLRKMPNGNPLYRCKVCGKEGINMNIKFHMH